MATDEDIALFSQTLTVCDKKFIKN